MFTSLSRSWKLVRASVGVLRTDKELALFPVISALALLLVLLSFAIPFALLGGLDALRAGERPEGVEYYLLLFLFYLTQYFVIFSFNTALVGVALIRLQGGNPVVWDGLRIASRRIGAIFGYALLSATVGLGLRYVVENAGGVVGKVIISLVGMTWSIASYLVIPIIAAERPGAIGAVKRSAGLLRRTWGEQLAGNLAIGTVFLLPVLLLICLGFAAGFLIIVSEQVALGLALATLSICGIAILAVLQATLSGIYAAALYRYAASGQLSPGFDAELIAGAFRSK